MRMLLSALNALLGLVLTLTPFWLAPVCSQMAPHGGPMKCYYSGLFVVGMGAVILFFALIALLQPLARFAVDAVADDQLAVFEAAPQRRFQPRAHDEIALVIDADDLQRIGTAGGAQRRQKSLRRHAVDPLHVPQALEDVPGQVEHRRLAREDDAVDVGIVPRRHDDDVGAEAVGGAARAAGQADRQDRARIEEEREQQHRHHKAETPPGAAADVFARDGRRAQGSARHLSAIP